MLHDIFDFHVKARVIHDDRFNPGSKYGKSQNGMFRPLSIFHIPTSFLSSYIINFTKNTQKYVRNKLNVNPFYNRFQLKKYSKIDDSLFCCQKGYLFIRLTRKKVSTCHLHSIYNLSILHS